MRLIESGPVGGRRRGAAHRAALGARDMLAFDMGGTTAKRLLIRDGELAAHRTTSKSHASHRFKPGSGLPVAIPAVDLIEIGAGGGSIARVDRSASSRSGPIAPGPIRARPATAAAAREPTVTDADLVLGYLDPDGFLGGTMQLDRAAAERASSTARSPSRSACRPSRRPGASTTSSTRTWPRLCGCTSAERGGDLSQSTLIPFGGAGPVHAYRMAQSLGVPKMAIPRAAGVLSAMGFLVAPVSYEVSRTYQRLVADGDPADLGSIYSMLETEATEVVHGAAPESEVAYQRAADARYVGQSHTIRVNLGQPPVLDQRTLRAAFEREYEMLYGLVYANHDIQLVNLIAVATATGSHPSILDPVPRRPPIGASS